MVKNTKVIDISSKIRKLYLISSLTGFGFIMMINIVFNLSGIVVFSLLFILLIFVLYGIDYFITRNKIVLNLGNILVNKDKEYFLSKGMKNLDTLRIRNELDYDEQNKDAFTEFLVKSELDKYDKIYLQVQILKRILSLFQI